MLALLDETELSVGELARSLGMAQSRVSNHLRLLREAGLLEERQIFAFGVDGQILLDFGDGVVLALLGYSWGLNVPGDSTTYDLAMVPFGEPGRVELSRIESEIAAEMKRPLPSNFAVQRLKWERLLLKDEIDSWERLICAAGLPLRPLRFHTLRPPGPPVFYQSLQRFVRWLG